MPTRFPRRGIRPRAALQLTALEDRATPAVGLGLSALALGNVEGSGATSLVAASAPVPGEDTQVRVTYGGSGATNGGVLPGTVNDAGPPVYLPPGTVLSQFTPFSGFGGPLSLAVGDFDRDGVQDVAVGAGPGGGPRVQIVSGQDGSTLYDVFAFDPSFNGGVRLAADDLDDDGYAELVAVAGPGGAPHVQVFSSTGGGELTSRFSFYATEAFAQSFTGGLTVATGRLLNRANDGQTYLVLGAGEGGGPVVAVYDLSGSAPELVTTFMAGDAADRNGVAVTAVTGEWIDGAIAATPVRVAAGTAPTVSLFRLGGTDATGMTVGAAQTVTLGRLSGPAALAAGGFVYPDTVVFFAADGTSELVHAFGVTAAGEFLTVDGYNADAAGEHPLAVYPSDPDALAVVPAFDPAGSLTVSHRLSDGTVVPVAHGFVALSMAQTRSVDYQPPYRIEVTTPGVTAGFDEGLRGDRSKWFTLPTAEEEAKASVLTKEYGPVMTRFEVRKDVMGNSPRWLADRVKSAALLLVNQTHYQNHHAPNWVPDLNHPWHPVTFFPRQGPGIDCSNFTGFLYNFALGLKLDTGIVAQPGLTSAEQSYEDGTTGEVPIAVTPWAATPPSADPAARAGAYQKLLNDLRPGDLLYICGTSPTTAKTGKDGEPAAGHVIMWLGQTDANGTPLVVDSTGYEHVDSNGVHIPDGVRVRPFARDGVNSWYFSDLLSYSRIIPWGNTPYTLVQN